MQLSQDGSKLDLAVQTLVVFEKKKC